jgi:predicted TPR repeat methyltransferase
LWNIRLLNIENDPAAQGFAGRREFDLIVAANVIHATADLRQTLGHVQQLLAPGGLLLHAGDDPPDSLD